MHINSYINKDINITEKLPYNLQFIIDEMEEYDKAGSALYFTSMDDFVDALKNCYIGGGVSTNTKRQLEEKYIYHAYLIAEREEANNGNPDI